MCTVQGELSKMQVLSKTASRGNSWRGPGDFEDATIMDWRAKSIPVRKKPWESATYFFHREDRPFPYFPQINIEPQKGEVPQKEFPLRMVFFWVTVPCSSVGG